MRRLLLIGALVAAAGHAQPVEEADATLAQVRAEAEAASARAATLAREAAEAGNEADRLAAERAALAAELEARDARRAALEIEAAELTAERERIETRLAAEAAPASALYAGLASLSRRPPVLTLADAGSVEKLVRLQSLAGIIGPAIEERTAATRAARQRIAALAAATSQRQTELAEEIVNLEATVARLATLAAEQREAATNLAGEAARADLRAIAANEQTAEFEDQAERTRYSREFAEALGNYGAAPIRPGRLSGDEVDDGRPRPSFDYQLPIEGAVLQGLGSLSRDGVRARGILIDAAPGAEIDVPASGTLLFAGAFRDRDGVVVIDHGNGWISLITNLQTAVTPDSRVRRGNRLGRALGPVGVELWHDGVPQPAALIAGSSY
ncbi:murein hydrolase activator EnvC family protein [Sphingomicrobium sediminis]|uniref:Peptidoglycan DD-metalloendopeptidase family protein n=1 Tax=Sphingomicrobium sediminis TaxID=2950949 RepID=A0A9X2J3U9_9SPHN|nr:peptidoglycan DD-metalloendopeptidase family protein [Sphingomicrobium sediminis]MCM8557696.1 peptidoglycan DD-metalloendopeptidase family protein [Sphingomicrobium sediminis]